MSAKPVPGSPAPSSATNRRNFLKYSAATAAAVAVGSTASPAAAHTMPSRKARPHSDIEELTVAAMQAAMAAGKLSSARLTRMYLQRIDKIDNGPIDLRAVIEVNPDAVDIARALDRERKQGKLRGPLHGIPILLKDNIDTDDATLTTAGSLALVDSRPGADATVAARAPGGRRRHPRQGQPLGMGQLPGFPEFQRLECPPGRLPQPVRPRPQPVRFVVGFGCRRVGQPVRPSPSAPRPTARSSARRRPTASSASSRRSG